MAYKFNESHKNLSPREIYADIKEKAPGDILLKVDDYLSRSKGWVSREKLCVDLFGKFTFSLDRNLRDAVADLVTYLHRPFIATSNSKGYKYAESDDEIDSGIADLEKRVSTTNQRIAGLREAKYILIEKVNSVPASQSFHGLQGRLFPNV